MRNTDDIGEVQVQWVHTGKGSNPETDVQHSQLTSKHVFPLSSDTCGP